MCPTKQGLSLANSSSPEHLPVSQTLSKERLQTKIPPELLGEKLARTLGFSLKCLNSRYRALLQRENTVTFGIRHWGGRRDKWLFLLLTCLCLLV